MSKKNDLKDTMREGCLHSAIGSAVLTLELIAGIVIAVLLLGCTKREYIEVEKVVEMHDTLREVQVKYDSIYDHDSIYFYEYVKGDTIYKEKYKEHTKYIERVKRDTITQTRSEYIQVPRPYPVIKYVEKPLKSWQKWLMGIGALSILCLALWIAWKIKRKI